MLSRTSRDTIILNVENQKFNGFNFIKLDEYIRGRDRYNEFIFNLLIKRITTVETLLERETGIMLNTSAQQDDPYALGGPFKYITATTTHNMQISEIRRDISLLKQIVTKTIAEIDVIETVLHVQANLLLNQVGYSEQIANHLLLVENFVGNLGKQESIRQKQESVDSAINLGKNVWKIIKGLIEWIPGVEGVLDSVQDLSEGLFSLIQGAADIILKINSASDLVGGTDLARSLSLLLSDASTLKTEIKSHNMIQGLLINSMLESVNKLSGISRGLLVPLEHVPTVTYYLRPIKELGQAVSWIGDKTIGEIRSQSDINLRSLIERVPLHAYVIVRFQLSGTIRRMITASAGDADSRQALSILFGGQAPSNLFGYEDQLQELVNGVWTVKSKLNTAKYRPDQFDEYEEQSKTAQLAETYDFRKSYNLVLEFLECMRKLELNYDLLDNNCQHMCKKILDYIVSDIKPNWWSAKCSAQLAYSELSHKFQIPAYLGIQMPPNFGDTGNYLTQNGMNPNALTASRNLVNAERAVVLSELVQII